MTTHWYWLAGVLLLVACGDSEGPDNGDSGAGAGGSAVTGGIGGSPDAGGAAGSGGDVGDGGIAGDGSAGSAGSSGDAGSSGTGGSGGSAGGVPAELNECESDDDCKLAGDCCSCASVPKGASVSSCRAACEVDRCTELGVSAVCAQGRCIFDATCDDSEVTCERTPPECAPGTQAIVQGDCWGDCVDVRECRAVKSCEACDDDQACVAVGPMFPILQCWDVAPACDGTPTCECMGSDICAPFSCGDASSSPDDPVDLGCYCVVC